MCLLNACVGTRDFLDDHSDVQDWTIFRGSPSLCGYTDCALPDVPQLEWSVTTQTRTVASPIVFNSVVYMLSRKGELRGYTMEGDSCFYHDLKTTVEASFIAMDTTLYIGRIDGKVTALPLNSHLSPLTSHLSPLTSHLSGSMRRWGRFRVRRMWWMVSCWWEVTTGACTRCRLGRAGRRGSLRRATTSMARRLCGSIT